MMAIEFEDEEDYCERRCCECDAVTDELVPTVRGSTYKVCRDCWIGDNWED